MGVRGGQTVMEFLQLLLHSNISLRNSDHIRRRRSKSYYVYHPAGFYNSPVSFFMKDTLYDNNNNNNNVYTYNVVIRTGLALCTVNTVNRRTRVQWECRDLIQLQTYRHQIVCSWLQVNRNWSDFLSVKSNTPNGVYYNTQTYRQCDSKTELMNEVDSNARDFNWERERERNNVLHVDWETNFGKEKKKRHMDNILFQIDFKADSITTQ